MIEAEAHDLGQLVGERRLEVGKPGLAYAEQGRADGLVRAAFRGERQPRRRRHQHEPRVLVAGVVERIQPAGDERVVQRADRQQPLAEQFVRKPERRQHQE